MSDACAAAAETLASLPTLVREARESCGMSHRELGDLLGISYATIRRVELREGCHVHSAVVLLRWLGGGP